MWKDLEQKAEAETLPAVFLSNSRKYAHKTFLMYKDQGNWKEVSWQEAYFKVRDIALGLVAMGLEKGDRVSVISKTIPEVAYCCTAIASTGLIFNPIYPTLNAKETLHILSDIESRILFVDDETQLKKVLEIWEDCPKIEWVIIFESKDLFDPRIMTLSELMRKGRDLFRDDPDGVFFRKAHEVRPSDISAIIYTSGTTGAPKGVMLSDEGFIHHFTSIGRFIPFSENDKAVSYLPMAHLLELMDGHWRHVYFGYTQIYSSVKTVYDDIIETKPTLIWNTPRFFEKLYKSLLKEAERLPRFLRGFLKPFTVEGGALNRSKLGNNSFVFSLKAWVAKWLLRRLLERLIGRNVKWASCGGAPIAPALIEFFGFCGLPMYEAYGLTEGHGLVSTNRPGAFKVGSVGKPLDGVEVGIGSDGEILVRGPFRSRGYWKREDLTKELFKDGWLHTGDTGFLDEDGFLHLTGRKKEIIITSSGHNIPPAKIENLLKRSPYISDAVVVGHGKDYISAIIFPNKTELEEFAKQRGIECKSLGELLERPEVTTLFEAEIDMANRELPGVEKIRRFRLLAKEFTPEDEEVTPTMKIKRHVFEKKYATLIDSMYEQGD